MRTNVQSGLDARARERRHRNEAIHCFWCDCCPTGHCSINAAMLLHLFVDTGKMGKFKTV